MSCFACEHCGVTQQDSGAAGYTSGCCHYPPENSRRVRLRFDASGAGDADGFFWRAEGLWYLSDGRKDRRSAVQPIQWWDIKARRN